MIRQLNRRMDREARREARFDELIREMLAAGDARQQREHPRSGCRPHRFDWAEEQADLWVDWLKASGVHIVGDVEDLRPVRPTPRTTGSTRTRVGATSSS